MNKVKSVLFMAGVSLALAFTFSCSGDSSGGGGTEISSSSTDESSSSANENGSVKKDHISGLSQKGPFMKGSTAVLYELDDKFVQTGRSFRDIIADDKGSFDIKINVELVSPYAMLEADGYYRNEVTGNPSTGTIKLYAIADIREKSNVNVNILTHLEYYRVQKLVGEGKSLKDAKKQAQEEILAVFGISGSFENSEDMSIFGTTEGDAALLAISVLLQGSLSEGQFVERLTDFRLGFRETGIWDSKAAKDAMADWAVEASLGSIRNNILGWNLSSAVPDFEKFVNNYWYANYGLGVCDAGLQNSIKNSNRGVDYICKSNAWAVATEYERDTYQWVCTEDEIKAGQASGKKYICKNNAWAIATEYELDTYQWVCTLGEIKDGQASGKKYICKNNAWAIATEYELDTYQWVCTLGEIKDGQASGKKYICKDNSWVIATEYEIQVGLCSKEGEIKSGVKDGKKYICKNNAWAIATEYELDTYQWVCSLGEIKDGQVSGKKYICKNGNWQTPPKYIEIKCFESKSCLTFTDERDNQSYVYVVIGEQTWMAENLNYNANGSICDDNNCATYGRLYDWETAKKACPVGWHLPTSTEWNVLLKYVDPDLVSNNYSIVGGKKLRATSGWDNGNGTDDYGFAALPGTDGHPYWWAATENDAYFCFMKSSQYINCQGGNGFSSAYVRCMQN